MNSEDLSHVALVTGAANGLGKAMVIGLIGRGLRVAAVDQDLTGLNRLREELGGRADPGRLALFAEDLLAFDPNDLVSRVEEQFGRIDILINNAGVGQVQVRSDYHRNPPRFYEVTPEQWTRAVTVNANAVFLLSRAVVKPMMRRKWGRIINITTSLGTMLRGGYAPYGPSKAAAEALSAVMAADLAGTGVTANVLIPGGIVNTPMIPADAPFSRNELIQPEAMLPALYWLVSPDSDAVTGRRFLATKWDSALGANIAAEKAGAPIGWKDIAVLPVTPKFK
jgi:NAD(P)-dependent dehydrogenase (short-subunit alcohol dehydrogenase family)